MVHGTRTTHHISPTEFCIVADIEFDSSSGGGSGICTIAIPVEEHVGGQGCLLALSTHVQHAKHT